MVREFTAVFEEDEGWIWGYAEELPGAFGQGRTLEEARESLRDAIGLILEDLREEAEARRAGKHVVREPISVAVQ